MRWKWSNGPNGLHWAGRLVQPVFPFLLRHPHCRLLSRQNVIFHLCYILTLTYIHCSSRSASVCATPLHRRLHPNVMIECESGVKYYADHVICTVPLGVIKESAETLFAPPLPADKRAAIEKLHFGTVNKIFLEYDRPFLSPDVDEIVLLWDDTAQSEIPMKERWFRKIYSFAKQSDTLLIGWISGEEARCVYSTYFGGTGLIY